MASDLDLLTERSGWTVGAGVARYGDTGWTACARPVRVPGRSFERWQVAVMDAAGFARYTTTAATVNEVARVAEAQVRGRKAAPSPATQ